MVRVQLPISDTEVDLVSMDVLLEWLGENSTEHRLLLGHNLHSLYLCEKDTGFRQMYERADLVLADGFPVWTAAKKCAKQMPSDLREAASRSPRIGSTDWLPRLDRVGRSLRIAAIGASPESNAEAVRRLTDQFPLHQFIGWDGFDGRVSLELDGFAGLTEFAPDLVLVGLGMPRQEQWLDQHWSSLPPAVYAAVGGAIDQLSGNQRPAPRWLGHLGIEWVWRLLSQPRRLAGRYLVEPFKLAYVLGRKRASQDRPSIGAS